MGLKRTRQKWEAGEVRMRDILMSWAERSGRHEVGKLVGKARLLEGALGREGTTSWKAQPPSSTVPGKTWASCSIGGIE